MKTLSDIFINFRKEQSLTQSQLGRLLGITQQAIAKYESKKTRNLSPSLALRFEKATGGMVTRDELLFPELYQDKEL